MKSRKRFLSSIIMLLLSILSLIYYIGHIILLCLLDRQFGYSEPIAWYLFVIFAIVGIVFFILGLAAKDKLDSPKDTDKTDK